MGMYESEFLCRINWTLNLRCEHFRQQKIKYGAVQGGSTAAFFRVRKDFTKNIFVDKLLLFFCFIVELFSSDFI